MQDKKNIVIKVKYPTAKPDGQIIPATVTTWHMPRIISAAALLALLIGGLSYFLLAKRPEDIPQIVNESEDIAIKQTPQALSATALTPEPTAEKPKLSAQHPAALDKTQNNAQQDTHADTAPKQTTASKQSNKPPIKNPIRSNKTTTTETSPKAEPPRHDKNLIRAILSPSIIGKEPGHEIAGSITAKLSSPTTLFYFTELRNMDGQTVYHEWRHNGKLVAKYELHVAADRWRTSSRRSFSDKAKGEWSVKLIDGNHKLLNQKFFNVKEGAAR